MNEDKCAVINVKLSENETLEYNEMVSAFVELLGMTPIEMSADTIRKALREAMDKFFSLKGK